MTNKDKYLKDGVDLKEFICGLRDYLDSHNDNYDTSNLINNYLNKTAKPTLTEDEKVILKNIKRYELVGRDKVLDAGEYNLYVTNAPFDFEISFADLSCINHLFQFIKPRRRI